MRGDARLSGILSEELGEGPAAPTMRYGNSVLRLPSGANQIEWQYNLKTNAQSTYGGEVIQVLGASVGPIRISGNTRSRQEYVAIKNWIVAAMTALGTGNRRNERPIVLEYAERGWALEIMPIEFGPWQLDDKIVATEWFLTAEVVSPTANGLVEATMTQQQLGIPDSSLLAPHAFDHWQSLFDPAANGEADKLNELAEQTGNRLDLTLAHIINGSFDLFGSFGNNAGAEVDDVYKEAFGTEWLVPPSGAGAGGAGAGSAAGLTGKLLYVHTIMTAWEAKNMPARMGVATALGESRMDPNAWNGNYMGLFQTAPSGHGGSAPNAKSVRAAFAEVQGLAEGPKPVISEKYPAEQQIEDAASWFGNGRPSGADKTFSDKAACMTWAETAQGAHGQFSAWWDRTWREAATLMAEATAAATSGGGGLLPSLTGKALSNAILGHPRFNGTDPSSTIYSDIAEYEAAGVQPHVLQGMLGIMNAGWNLRISSIKTGRDGPNHGPGKAFDANNYGPDGAGSSGGLGLHASSKNGGTSSKDPTKFIAFLKQNRAALGGLRIGYGSPSAGADFADQFHHVHIDWTHSSAAEIAAAHAASGAGSSGGPGPMIADARVGSPVPGQDAKSSGTHPTAGLAGYPAHDYFADANTPCVAPVSGTISQFSGHDPAEGGPPGGAFGWSIYLDGDNGKRYFLTHLGSRTCKVGDRVKQGQQIGTVGDGPPSWSVPHIHMGISG